MNNQNTLGQLKGGQLFEFGGVRFIVVDNEPSLERPNEDYLLHCEIMDGDTFTGKFVYIANTAWVNY